VETAAGLDDRSEVDVRLDQEREEQIVNGATGCECQFNVTTDELNGLASRAGV
jgi:hypothetical protein